MTSAAKGMMTVSAHSDGMVPITSFFFVRGNATGAGACPDFAGGVASTRLFSPAKYKLWAREHRVMFEQGQGAMRQLQTLAQNAMS